MRKEITSKIVKKICIVDTDTSRPILFGQVSWNGREPKGYDIRQYVSEDDKVYKGISLTYNGLENIILAAIENGCCDRDKVLHSVKKADAKVFSTSDFDNMFNNIAIETEKYTRDCYGILRDDDGRRVIMRRKNSRGG